VSATAEAYVTLVTNAGYGLGALALARSLKLVGARRPLVVLATEGAGGGLDQLAAEWCEIVRVAALPLSAPFRERHARAGRRSRWCTTSTRSRGPLSTRSGTGSGR
jgi:hypothetical protein